MTSESCPSRERSSDDLGKSFGELPENALKSWDGTERTQSLQSLGSADWHGAEQTQALPIGPSPTAQGMWDGTERTKSITIISEQRPSEHHVSKNTQEVVVVADEPTPVLLDAPASHRRPQSLTQPFSAGLPTAHIHITSTVAPFQGKRRSPQTAKT